MRSRAGAGLAAIGFGGILLLRLPDSQCVTWKRAHPFAAGGGSDFLARLVWTQVKANRLRAIAVTSATRSAFVPDLPTVAEAGVPGYEAGQWWGYSRRPRCRRASSFRLNSEINTILSAAEMKSRLANEGAEPVLMTPDAFTSFVGNEIVKFRKVVKERDIKPG